MVKGDLLKELKERVASSTYTAMYTTSCSKEKIGIEMHNDKNAWFRTDGDLSTIDLDCGIYVYDTKSKTEIINIDIKGIIEEAIKKYEFNRFK